MAIWNRRKKKQEDTQPYDPQIMKPVLKCSICNGEQVAGFKDVRTGQFHEVMLIRGAADLEAFKARYGLEQVPKEY